MLITDPKKRMQRSTEKQILILYFLKTEIYSNMNNLMLLMNYKSRRPLEILLNKMIARGFITKHKYIAENAIRCLWGITAQGQVECNELTDKFVLPYFESSKVKTWTRIHHLMNQEVRIYLERNGWTNWQNGDRFEFKKKYPVEHRPDALIVTPTGTPMAIETERSLKTKARYQEIIKSHLLAKKEGYWRRVIYVVPEQKMKAVLTNYFNAITYVNMNGSRITLNEEHRKTFYIFTLEEIKTFRFS